MSPAALTSGQGELTAPNDATGLLHWRSDTAKDIPYTCMCNKYCDTGYINMTQLGTFHTHICVTCIVTGNISLSYTILPARIQLNTSYYNI